MRIPLMFGLCMGVLLAAPPGGGDEIAIPAAVRTAGNRAPKFDNGRLIVFDRGQPSLDPVQIQILAAGAAAVTWEARDGMGRNLAVSDAAVAADGSGVVSTVAWAGSEDREFRLYVFDAKGKLAHSFSTNPYAAGLVTIDSGGAIWCFGAMGNRDDDPRAGYGVIRRYSRAGELQSEQIARSSFPVELPPTIDGAGGLPFLTATAQGVAAYSGQTGEWIELGADGALLSRERMELPAGVFPRSFARLADGSVLMQDAGNEFYRWAAKTGPAAPVSGLRGRLQGGFGNAIALEDWTGGTGRIRYAEPPGL